MSRFAAEWLMHLARREEDIFQYPRLTEEITLDQAIGRLVLAPEAVFDGCVEDDPDKMTWCHSYDRCGSSFYVYRNTFQVWLDVSESEPGSGGSAIYAAVGSFAHGCRYTFIGDPQGLSDMALRRRTDAMLSSALKYRGTSHLAPHQRQLDGSKELGVPPLVWCSDPVSNIQSMIHVAVDSMEFDLPEIKDVYYDFSAKAFCDPDGRPLLETVLGSWSDHLAGSGKTRAGISTLKRCILLRSLVCQKSESRSQLLEQILRESREFIDAGDLAEIFY
ncbi:hypothetical protein [Phytopseudomonas punonensis]|uniref:Large polyvalent protein associated domain-containing protein n=1 Tax=Phytopseudomonas punonensis TaxID=1220495 RepID=A0A1M7NSB9_9GAMM|nr:hypothetical protein [Pseudomonas punonensis]SHN06947.1 hypothetical protein SAMN05216288_0466 [Pseudomonas punonensis]